MEIDTSDQAWRLVRLYTGTIKRVAPDFAENANMLRPERHADSQVMVLVADSLSDCHDAYLISRHLVDFAAYRTLHERKFMSHCNRTAASPGAGADGPMPSKTVWSQPVVV